MELIRGEYNLRPRHRQCVMTIGNFDGVHLGHQAVLRQLIDQARRLGLPSLIMMFEPLPSEYFQGDKAPPRLSSLREKIEFLRSVAIDNVLCLRFDHRLANLPAREFVESLLVRGLATRFLVIGDDFRFGRGREGDFGMLRQAGSTHGFEVVNINAFEIDNQRVSSTRIRNALANGDMVLAEKLLGRPYRISGRVIQGDKRGRTIGFPTANIRLARRVSAVNGVFAVRISGLHKAPLSGVANVGTRPTVGGVFKQLEVHVFDFDGDLYGRHLHVDLLNKIRSEVKFDSFEALRQQIVRDAEAARAFLNSN